MTQRTYFIAGTDTDAGKTLAICSLIHKFQDAGHSVIALKPIAAGCETDADGKLRNDDALNIAEALATPISYEKINPIALASPIAPHIAAEQEDRCLSVSGLSQACQINQYDQEVILVEGAGGWLVPLNDKENMADFVANERLDVILVVGLKLGCINHALLTVNQIEQSGLQLKGWIANSVDANMNVVSENIAALAMRINAPFLGHIPFINETNKANIAAEYVTIAPLT